MKILKAHKLFICFRNITSSMWTHKDQLSLFSFTFVSDIFTNVTKYKQNKYIIFKNQNKMTDKNKTSLQLKTLPHNIIKLKQLQIPCPLPC